LRYTCLYPTKPINGEDYKDALVTMAAGLGGPLFHVTAMLPPGGTRPALEAAFRSWAARVDRAYLGRKWQNRENDRMDGIVFFETRPGHHIHAIVRPPAGVEVHDFLTNACSWFCSSPGADIDVVGGAGKPVVPRGRMMVQLIGPTPEDLARTVRYASKEVEFLSSAVSGWKFLRDLSPR
jgi:hypothetical protein